MRRSYVELEALVCLEFSYCFCNVSRLRKYCVFELRRVRHEGVERADAFHRRIEILEQLSGNARGDLRAVTKRKRIFVSDDHAVRSFHGFNDRVPVVRREAAQIDDLDADAFLFRLFCGDERTLDQSAVSDDRQVLAFANFLRLCQTES